MADATGNPGDDLSCFLDLLMEPSARDTRIARVLLEDFVALVGADRSQISAFAGSTWGAMELAAWMASGAALQDLDDVDWSGPHHPGSVVWATVLATAAAVRAPGDRILAAGVCGYRVARAAAAMLGAEHARRWHLTATAGVLGAAAAASFVRGDDPEVTLRALSFGILNAGGIGQAPAERMGAARATRAAAAAQGVLSALLARSNVPVARHPWSGSRGAEAVLQAGKLEIPDPSDMWVDIGLRLFPVNGFVQSAVGAMADALPEGAPHVDEVIWELPVDTVALVGTHDYGDWWNAKLAAARVVGTRSPWLADRSGPWDSAVDLVSLRGANRAIGTARVLVTTSLGSFSVEAPRQSVSDEEESMRLVRAKWSRVLHVDPDSVSGVVDGLITCQDGIHDLADRLGTLQDPGGR